MADPERASARLLGDHPLLRGVLVVGLLIVVVGMATRTLAEAGGLLSSVLVPVAVSLLLAGLLMPFQVFFNHRLRLPRYAAAFLTILLSLAAVLGLLWVAGSQVATGFTDIQAAAIDQLGALQEWVIAASPLGRAEISAAIAQAQAWLGENQTSLAAGIFGAGLTAVGVVISAILSLVAAFFFLAQGDRIWAGLCQLLPVDWRRRAYEASRRGWVTLSTYCRTQLAVSAVDALGIGLGALLIGVPFVLPLVAISFVLCFIPFVGAVLSSAVAIALALGFNGPGAALLMLAVCVIVLQLESNVLAPLLMGRAVDVHPLLILLSVAAGTYMLGLVGALFAVPVIATIKSMASYLNGADPFPKLDRGGSALTNSPRRLVSWEGPIKSPPRVGDATLRWLEGELDQQQAAREEGGASAAP